MFALLKGSKVSSLIKWIGKFLDAHTSQKASNQHRCKLKRLKVQKKRSSNQNPQRNIKISRTSMDRAVRWCRKYMDRTKCRASGKTQWKCHENLWTGLSAQVQPDKWMDNFSRSYCFWENPSVAWTGLSAPEDRTNLRTIGADTITASSSLE